jgi:hypothetical protein
MIAGYWADLNLAGAGNGVCRKTVGGNLVIQFRGVLFGTTTKVEFQIIMNPTADTVELVYGANQQQTGDDATIGIENQIGSVASQVGFLQSGVITVPGSKLFTPN